MRKNEENFENLIKKEKYQVFVLSCPIYFPFGLARYGWFVVNKKGIVSRYEVRHDNAKSDSKYFKINTEFPFKGIELTFFIKNIFRKGKLEGSIEGYDNSVAQKAVEFLEKTEKNYPYYFKYSFLGPNSNTYVQNVLNHFPEFKVKLSWRFIGKNFKLD